MPAIRSHSPFLAELWLQSRFLQDDWLRLDPALYDAWFRKCQACGTSWEMFQELRKEFHIRLDYMKFFLAERYPVLMKVQHSLDLDEISRLAWYKQIYAAINKEDVDRLETRFTRLLSNLRAQGYIQSRKNKTPGKRLKNCTVQSVNHCSYCKPEWTGWYCFHCRTK